MKRNHSNYIIEKDFGWWPAAHRQYLHAGRCFNVHGHEYKIQVEFGCSEPDEQGFVLDFGKLKFIKNYLNDNVDHGFFVDENDPLREQFEQMEKNGYARVLIVPSSSAEGLAKFLYETFNKKVEDDSEGRAWINAVTVHEGPGNLAIYRPTV